MPIIDAVVSSPVSTSMRCRQIECLFDIPSQEKQTLRWSGDVPLDNRAWNVGLIVGPSGCGKSTVARALFGNDALLSTLKWSKQSVLDDFPATSSLEDIAAICQAVGFNTIPAWLRPFAVLSNGEQFRVTLARRLLETSKQTIMDEFTSVVDRQVARIGSHAVQKYVRKNNTQFVAISCHDDIVEWLNPDWILEPATMTFTWRSLQRRPTIETTIARVEYSTWRTFAPYHYMSADLNKAAQCFGLFVNKQLAAFAGVLYRPHPKAQNIYGISRLVTLPDYQGLGLAFVLTDTLGAAFRACKKRLHMYPAHPSLIRSYDRSIAWKLEMRPGLHNISPTVKMGFGGRPNAMFSYCGPAALDANAAQLFLGIPSVNVTL